MMNEPLVATRAGYHLNFYSDDACQVNCCVVHALNHDPSARYNPAAVSPFAVRFVTVSPFRQFAFLPVIAGHHVLMFCAG